MKIAFLLAALCAYALQAHAASYYVIVAGLGGEPDYDQRFTAAAKDLDRIFRSAGPGAHVFTLTGAQSTASQLTDALNQIAREAKSDDDFTLILIGHGSFDGVEYKFNLVGPDVTAAQIASLCDHIPTRRQLIVNTTSAAGGAMHDLERPGRKKAVVQQKATSCDLCTHLKEPSCVYACPHDAAHRVDPRQFFNALMGQGPRA